MNKQGPEGVEGQRISVIDMQVNVTSLNQVLNQVASWAQEPQGRYVCVSNVHMCMEVHDSTVFRQVVNGADLVVADGKPIQVAQRLLGAPQAGQVRGMDLTLGLCELAAREGIRVGFYGGAPEVLVEMQQALVKAYPGLDIGYSYSPPFRALSADEDADICRQINASGARILFVGLGCPKQEAWMAAHRDSVQGVMLGVGAAFDFIAGRKQHAPRWMQAVALEWLFRLASEPRRLWARYLKHNPRFVLYFLRQWLGARRSTPGAA